METTIDGAGRLVIPKELREEVGLVPGPVDVRRDGAGVRIEPVTGSGLAEHDGLLVIPASTAVIDDEVVRRLRHADQR